MKQITIGLLLFFVLALNLRAQTTNSLPSPQVKPLPQAPATPQTTEKLTAQTYAELLDKLKKGDTSIDFRKLRFAFTETNGYSAMGVSKERTEKMYTAFEAKKYEDALAAAEAILATDYVDMIAHLIAQAAYKQLGKTKEAQFHSDVLFGLAQSILKSGDGKTAQTAFVVIRVDEEYALMNLIGVRKSSQELVRQNGHAYDLMSVVDEQTKEARKIYFNVDKAFESYEKLLKK